MHTLTRLALSATLAALAAGAAVAGPNGTDTAPALQASPMAAPGKAKVFTAVVDGSGAFVRGSAGATSGTLGAGLYEVFFVDKNLLPVDVSGCSYVATLGTTSFGTAAPGVVTTASRVTAANGVWVTTYDMAGASSARSFHLEVACP